MTVTNRRLLCLFLISILHLSWTVCSLRPRALSSSSQSERSANPLVMTSTHSLETMPRVALSTDDEGTFRHCLEIHSERLYNYVLTFQYLQPRWSCRTFGGSGFVATAQGPNTHLPRSRPDLDALETNWRRPTNRGFPVEGRFPSRHLSRPCPSSSPQVVK